MKCEYCSKEHEKNNTGCYNSGDCNSGDCNSGNRNSGDCNSGNRNSGDCNSGDCNSGDCNSGDCNSGNFNSGHYNSGHYNSGHCNSGNRNSGDCNSGDCNSGNFNSGWFNTNEPKMRMFNKDTEITYSEFIKGRVVYPDLKLNSWVEIDSLPLDEQTESVRQMGGKLKTLTYKDAWKEYWSRASEEDKQWFMDLPNFDAGIFEEITGINVVEDDEVAKAIKLLTEKGRIKDGKIIYEETNTQ